MDEDPPWTNLLGPAKYTYPLGYQEKSAENLSSQSHPDVWAKGVVFSVVPSPGTMTWSVHALFPPMHITYKVSQEIVANAPTDVAIHGVAIAMSKYAQEAAYYAIVENLKKVALFTDPPKSVNATSAPFASWVPSHSLGESVMAALKKALPEGSLQTPVDCPGAGEKVYDGLICESKKPCPLSDRIMHLNDSHRWTREQIADWLDTLDVDLTFKATSEGDQ